MSQIKEILCLHHSHLDIGYTHPQPMLLELQKDYISEALELCLLTEEEAEDSKFRWTCEVTYPVMQWLETASAKEVEIFQRLNSKGQISIAAFPFHTTPLMNADQLARMLYPVRVLREKYNLSIKVAISHDVNGHPWPISQVLLDAGIEFYMTGINIHYGGIPMPRPTAFRWQTPDQRELLTFHGEHYSLFSQFFSTSMNDTEIMEVGIREYISRLKKNGYQYDFIYLSATNPPLYDNNSPDRNLLSLISRYNSEGHEQKIIFATPEMLLERVRRIPKERLSLHRGDWTDYWNFGASSSARETGISRRTKQNIKKAEFLESLQGASNLHYTKVKNSAIEQMLLFDEHTWGASFSVTKPDDHEIIAQRTHKAHMAYKAADLSAYILSKQSEQVAQNEKQSIEPEGIMLVNTSDVKQQVILDLPEDYSVKGRHLSALRAKDFLPYGQQERRTVSYGAVNLAPYSWKRIPFEVLNENVANSSSNNFIINDYTIDTPYYTLTFDPKSGRIIQLYNKHLDWPMLDVSSPWTFFEFVRETIDTLHHENNRATFFPRDIDKGNKNISVWNHEWKSVRSGANKIQSHTIESSTGKITYVMRLKSSHCKSIEQRITFFENDPKILLQANLELLDTRTPESIYFTFPLNMNKDWKAQYDTAGMFVELDTEQLGEVCRDWITVDQTVSMYDENKGVTLACPDAPLVQLGDFNFGKESKGISRDENPLLLVWPINNYWDTNFWASQPGRVNLSYELSTFNKFDPKRAYEAGISAVNPVVVNVATSCRDEQEGTWFSTNQNNIVSSYIKPAIDGEGFIISLRNIGSTAAEYVFKQHTQKIKSASLVNLLEQCIDVLNHEQDEVSVMLQPDEMQYLKIELL